MRVVAPAGLIAERYRLLSPLGSGGSATVWAAADETLGRQVALKLLTSTAAADSDEREQLRREARALAALTHPHIIVVFDFLEAPGLDGAVQPVLITELLDGRSLAARLAEGRLPWQEALSVSGQLAGALAAAHRAGIVHRDVTPANVMLTGSGIKLLDFGIAAATHEGAADDGMTVGTPVCMAPEQLTGHGALPASDVYALGCVLHWCLTGRPPYRDRDITWLTQAHLRAAPPPLAIDGLPEGINELYLACLAKDPDERPTAKQAAKALAPYAPSSASPAAAAAAASATAPTAVVAAVAVAAAAPTAVLASGFAPTGRESQSDDATQALPVLASAGAVAVTTYASSAPDAALTTPTTSGVPPRSPRRHAGRSRAFNRRRLLPVGLLVAALAVVSLLMLGLDNAMTSDGTSATGSKGAAMPTTGASGTGTATVPIVTLPSGPAVPSASTSASPPSSGSASPSASVSASQTASATVAIPALPNPAGDPIGYLQALDNQIQALVAQGPGTLQADAGQNLINSIGPLQSDIAAAQQNNGKKAWRTVTNAIASIQQQISNDAAAGQISTSASNLLAGEVQSLSDSLSATSSGYGN